MKKNEHTHCESNEFASMVKSPLTWNLIALGMLIITL